MEDDMNNLSYNDVDSLEGAASAWSTCAVGNLCQSIPRNEDDEPEDNKLKDLGMLFMRECEDMMEAYNEDDEGAFKLHQSEARKLHDKIEARATEILTDMGLLKTK